MKKSVARAAAKDITAKIVLSNRGFLQNFVDGLAREAHDEMIYHGEYTLEDIALLEHAILNGHKVDIAITGEGVVAITIKKRPCCARAAALPLSL
jgi:hypothetical protein